MRAAVTNQPLFFVDSGFSFDVMTLWKRLDGGGRSMIDRCREWRCWFSEAWDQALVVLRCRVHDTFIYVFCTAVSTSVRYERVNYGYLCRLFNNCSQNWSNNLTQRRTPLYISPLLLLRRFIVKRGHLMPMGS